MLRAFVALMISISLVIASVDISLAQEECTITWGGDLSGSVPTNETSRTKAATVEAFQAIWGSAPDDCVDEPGHAYDCYIFATSVEGCWEDCVEGCQERWFVNDQGHYGHYQTCLHPYELQAIEQGYWVISGCPWPPCVGTAEASIGKASPVYGPSILGRDLTCLLIPLGAMIGLMIWRRKK